MSCKTVNKTYHYGINSIDDINLGRKIIEKNHIYACM